MCILYGYVLTHSAAMCWLPNLPVQWNGLQQGEWNQPEWSTLYAGKLNHNWRLKHAIFRSWCQLRLKTVQLSLYYTQYLMTRTLKWCCWGQPELRNMFCLRKGRRVEQVPLQQITNLAYGPRYLHPSLVSEEMAWIEGFNSKSRTLKLKESHFQVRMCGKLMQLLE